MKQSQQLLQVLENGTCSMRPTCKPNFTTVPARNMLKASTLISTYYCVDADVHNTTDMCLGAPSMTHHAEEHFGQVPCWLPTDDDQVTLWVIVCRQLRCCEQAARRTSLQSVIGLFCSPCLIHFCIWHVCLSLQTTTNILNSYACSVGRSSRGCAAGLGKCIPAVWKVCGNHQMVCCCLDSVLSVLDVIRSRAIGGCEQKNGAAVMQRYLVTASATFIMQNPIQEKAN